MVVKVASRVGQAFSRSLSSLSLADGSMLLRMRRASIALLALVGAVGLGLIVFIAQLGWPGVVSGPLPGPPTQAGTVHDAIALSQAAPGTGVAGPAAVASGRPAKDLAQSGTRAGGRSQLGDGKLAAAPGTEPGQGVDQPVAHAPSTPVAEPAPQPVTSPPASVPTTAAVESPTSSSSADQAKKATSAAKATETSVAKAVSHSSRSAAATPTESQNSAKDNGSTSTSGKSSEAASAKAKRHESVAKVKAKAPPPVVMPEKAPSTALNPAAAKEAADAAKSG